MKAILFTLFLIPVISLSQPMIQMGLGYSTLGYPTYELSGGYNSKLILLEGGYVTHLTRNAEAGAHMFIRAGHQFASDKYVIEPSVGYSYDLRSYDEKYMNTNNAIFSLYAGKNINSGTLLIGINYTENIFMTGLVMRYNFLKKVKYTN